MYILAFVVSVHNLPIQHCVVGLWQVNFFEGRLLKINCELIRRSKGKGQASGATSENNGSDTTTNGPEDAQITLEDVRLIHRPNRNHDKFLLKNMPMQLSKDFSQSASSNVHVQKATKKVLKCSGERLY